MSKLFAQYIFNPLFNNFMNNYLYVTKKHNLLDIDNLKTMLFLKNIDNNNDSSDSAKDDHSSDVDNNNDIINLKYFQYFQTQDLLFDQVAIDAYNKEIKVALNKTNLVADIINNIIFQYCEISIDFYQNLMLDALKNNHLLNLINTFDVNIEYNDNETTNKDLNLNNQCEIFSILNLDNLHKCDKLQLCELCELKKYLNQCYKVLKLFNSIPFSFVQLIDTTLMNNNSFNTDLLFKSISSMPQPIYPTDHTTEDPILLGAKHVFDFVIKAYIESENKSKDEQNNNEKVNNDDHVKNKMHKLKTINKFALTGADAFNIGVNAVECINDDQIVHTIIPMYSPMVINIRNILNDKTTRTIIAESIPASMQRIKQLLFLSEWATFLLDRKFDESSFDKCMKFSLYYFEQVKDYIINPEKIEAKLKLIPDLFPIIFEKLLNM